MISIRQITSWFSAKGNEIILSSENLDQVVVAPRAIDSALSEHISFLNKKFKEKTIGVLKESNCHLVILDSTIVEFVDLKDLPENKSYILSQNPKNDIIEFCKEYLNFDKELDESKIHSSAVIDKSVKINGYVQIDANAVIGANVIIGANCRIGAGTNIIENTIIGDNVEIGSNNVIGGVGFGYAQNDDTKEYEQFPHYGSVIIKNNVSIGNNTCVDRGSLSDTVINDGVKIDNLVHIAHNVKIGKNTLVIAHAMIAGSVSIGENCWIAPSSCIRNGVTIGNNVTVGLASTVVKNIEDNQTVMGSPAILIEDFKKLRAIQSKLIKED